MTLGVEEINRRLGFHPATDATIPRFEANRAAVIAAAKVFDETLPPGREAALAQTALQDALMWANAAVACSAPLVMPSAPTRSPARPPCDHPEHFWARSCPDGS